MLLAASPTNGTNVTSAYASFSVRNSPTPTPENLLLLVLLQRVGACAICKHNE